MKDMGLLERSGRVCDSDKKCSLVQIQCIVKIANK